MNLDAIGAWIAPFEGTRSSAYDDATGQHVLPGYMMRGNVSVGIGINLCYPNGLEPEEIEWLFKHRVAKRAQAVAQAFPWFQGLSPDAQSAIVDMAYNMGLPTLQTFDTFLGYMAAHEAEAAANDLLGTLWYQQAKDRGVQDVAAIRAATWTSPA